MSDPLREYLVGRGLSDDPDKPGQRTPRLRATGGIPIRATEFFEGLGVAPFSQFEQLKPELQARLAELQPAVLRLGPDFNYGRLMELAEKGGDKLDPEVRFKMMGIATLGMNEQITREQQASKEAGLIAANEFARQATLGLVPGIPEETLEHLTVSPQGIAVAKAVGGIAGIFTAGKLIVTGLSKVTMLPKIGAVVQQIPQRTKEIMLGVGTGAILDAARPDGLPEDPAAIDISARLAHPIADILGGGEVAERVALGVAGGGVGGAIGAALLPVVRGIQKMREARALSQWDDATIELVRGRLQAAGIAVETGETKQATIAKAFQHMDKISQTEKLAAISAADETRMGYVLNQLYTDPAFVGSDDLRYLAGVFRANPGGLSVVKGIGDPKAAEALVKQMGLNVVALKSGKDLLIMRPQSVFPEHGLVTGKIQRQMDDFTEQVKAASQGRPSNRLSILPDGQIVKGEYNAAEMVNRFKVTPPKIEGGKNYELALREHLGMVDVQVGEGGVVTVHLPSRVTQRQATALGRMADRGPPKMRIVSALKEKAPGPAPATIPGPEGGTIGTGLVNKEVTLENPFGMQVEDALSGLVQGATKPKITADMVKRVQQYQKESVFRGQAGVLPDGYPVEIIRRIGKKIVYRDPITGALHRTPVDNIAVLPTSLEGELKPSRQIFEAMDEAERALFAKLRRGINEGLAKPIVTIRDLESFAASRGKFVSPLGRGRVRVYDPNTGESQVFDNIKAATANLRGTLGPLPDLTPPEIEELLGFKPNLGGLASGGPPSKFGELIPITEDEFARAFETNTVGMLPPGAVAQFYEPTRGLAETLTRKYGMPFDKVFANLQQQTVHRQNFVAAWTEGLGLGLPKGIMPMKKIWKLAGKPDDGAQRLMGAWMEADTDAARKVIEGQLTSNQIKAVKEARKWLGLSEEEGLFKALDIEADWITDYLPHFRQHAEGFGNNLREGWRMSRGTPLPKSVEFFADFARDGSLNVYEDRLFVAMAQYLQSGARARYMNQAMVDAQRLIRAIPDNAVKGPLVNYIEALRGWEFTPQRAALDASFSNMLRTLGASEKAAKDLGERLTMALLGMSYQATMAFRPGLAIRNAAQILQTTWPLLGSITDDAFAEGLGRAMTRAGRDGAIRAGAISIKQTAMLGEGPAGSLPKSMEGMANLGFKLYDQADMFARSVTFNVAKVKSDKAIANYAKAIKAGKDGAAAQKALVKESGALVLNKRFVDEYLRRVANSPDAAGDFLGKQLTDIAQYLYGRGNQPRWMRSIPGRFLGQFGTWPLWWIDFVKRSTMNMWANGYQKEAMTFIGKIALVDLAIYESGRRINLDLRRWMATNSLFGIPPLSQPPAVNLLYGLAQLNRGMSEEVLGTYGSPANAQRLAIAKQTIAQTGLAFVPNFYAVRDLGRLLEATTPTEAMAAMLATRPSQEYTVQQRLDMLFDPGKMSTDIELQAQGETIPTATDILLKGMQVGGRDRIIVPQGNLPAQPPGATPMPGSQTGGSSSLRIKSKVEGPPSGIVEPSALPESIRTGESKPPSNY